MDVSNSSASHDVRAENDLIQRVLDASFGVHRELGPGLLESIYEAALFYELERLGLNIERQLPVPVTYQGQYLGVGYRADLIVENTLLLEIKSVSELTDDHVSQVLTYLKLLKLRRGYLLNFNKKLLKDGIKRISR